MSTTIDERVVEMRFDNKQFEKNVQTSLSSLDKLKQSLNFTGATKGLENINSAVKNVNMSGLSGAVETVHAKFSALEVMAVTALANITNSAVNAGKRIASALTIEPIKTGFQEYETQINAVQTILANTESKGSTLKDVNAALDELNTYADKTIYNFTEMTRNIGTFTAAGVDLDTSVSAIKGIANLAAVSGSTSQQASTAMYQLSQALASGTVKLQDWNSVVNAGMGGQVFQDALKETARVHGIAIDDMIKDEGSFRETLQKGWLTSDILTETLSKFTGDLNENQLRTMGYSEEQIQSIMKMGQTANDAATKVKTFTQLFDTLKEAAQSGWTQSWEIIVGDFEEAKELLTEASDIFGGIINESANARNEVLQGWKDLGGRTALIDAVRNAFEGLVSIVTPVKEAFREIFPPMTAQRLYDITEGLKNLTEKFKISDTTAENLKRTFKGVFAVLDIGVQAFKAVAGGVADLIGYFAPAGDGILSLTGKFGDYLVKLDETIKNTDLFHNIIKKVVDFIKTGVSVATDILKNAAEAVKKFISFVQEKFDFPGFELFHALLKRVHDRMSQVGDTAGSVKTSVVNAFDAMGKALEGSKFLQALEALWEGVKGIASGIAEAVKSLTEGLIEKIGNADFSKFFDAVGGISIGGIAIGITKFLKSISEPLEGLQGVLEGVTGILDGVRGCFEAYQQQLKAGTLLKIASAIAILTASIVALSLIDSDKLSSSLAAITMLFTELMASMAIINKIGGFDKNTRKAMSSMVTMSVAILLLATAMKTVGDLDWNGVAKGLTSIAGLSAIVVASAKVMSSGSGQMIKGATGLIAFAAAIKILASACKDLSALSWDELGRGLAGVGGLLAEVSIFLNTAKFSSKSVSTATGILILSAAMKVLASACEDFGSMSWTEIGKGLTSVGALLTEIALFTNLTGNAKNVTSTGVALVAIAASMKIFASAVSDFGVMSWEEIGKGLTAMGGALAEVAIATNLMPKNMVGIGTGLVIVAGALEIVADVLNKMGDMSWEEIGKGLVTLGGALAELAIGLNLMNGTLAGSAAMLVAASALAVLTPSLSILGAMSWEGIAKGLATLAGAFTIFGVAGMLLSPVIPAIIALAGAFALLGVGVAALGAGIALINLGGFFGELSALIPSFSLIVSSFVTGIAILTKAIIEAIPYILSAIAKGFIEICKVLTESAPVICETVTVLVESVVSALVTSIPLIVDGIFELIDCVGNTLAEYTPKLVQTVFDILLACLQGIADNIGLVVETAIDIVVNFINAIAEKLPDVIQAGFNLLLAFINGITDAINTNTPLLVDAINNLFWALVDAALAVLTGRLDLFKEAGQRIMNSGLIQGIKDKLAAFTDSIKNTITQGLNVIKSKLSEWTSSGKNLIASVISGIESKVSASKTTVINLVTNAYNGITEQFSKWTDAGRNLIEGLIGGIKEKAQAAVDAAKNVATSALNGVKSFLGINSPSTEFAMIGRWSIEGLINGLTSNISGVTNAIMSVGSSVLNGIKNVLGINSPSKEMEWAGLMVSEGFESGISETSGSEKAAQMGENTLNALRSVIEDDSSAQAIGESLVTEFANGIEMASDTAVNVARNFGEKVLTAFQTELSTDKFTAISTAIGTGLNSGFNAMGPALSVTVTQVVTSMLNTIQSKYPEFNTTGQTSMVKFNDGVNSRKVALRTTITQIVTDMLTAIKNKYAEFQTSGIALMTALADGITSKTSYVYDASIRVVTNAVSGIRSKYDGFYSAGAYLVDGFIKGIEDNIERAAWEAARMAAAALEAAEEELDIASPSKETYRVGAYFGQGFVNAVNDYKQKVYDAGKEMAVSAKDGLNDAISKIADIIDGNIDTQPTIRPVLDLTNVESNARRLNALFSSSQAMDISASMNREKGAEIQNGVNVPNGGNVYTFTQNNYSPKALSRIDIYRQTKNQFSTLKGLVET